METEIQYPVYVCVIGLIGAVLFVIGFILSIITLLNTFVDIMILGLVMFCIAGFLTEIYKRKKNETF